MDFAGGVNVNHAPAKYEVAAIQKMTVCCFEKVCLTHVILTPVRVEVGSEQRFLTPFPRVPGVPGVPGGPAGK